MSKYYRGKRTRNIYDPSSSEPFKISRSKLDLFLNCPRCFYIDRRLGVDRPPGYPFSLNSAVDALLKKEFDYFRSKKQPHPLMEDNQIDAIPFAHDSLEDWRNSLHKGIMYHHPTTNLLITGGVDDVWIDKSGKLIIVDYKATSKADEVTLDADWQIGYKRQMEIYQWLFRKNGFEVNNTGYFVYCNGDASKESFDSILEFRISLLPYEGSDDWVEGKVIEAHQCLSSKTIPTQSDDCDYCLYREEARSVESAT